MRLLRISLLFSSFIPRFNFSITRPLTNPLRERKAGKTPARHRVRTSDILDETPVTKPFGYPVRIQKMVDSSGSPTPADTKQGDDLRDTYEGKPSDV